MGDLHVTGGDPNMTEAPAFRPVGLVRPSYMPEDQAPDVDNDLLLAYIYKRLAPEKADKINALISSYRSWSTSYADLLASEYVKTGGYFGRKRARKGPAGSGSPDR